MRLRGKMQKQPRMTRILRISTEFYRKDRFGEPPKPDFYGGPQRSRATTLSEGRPYPCYPWLSHFGAREATIFSKRRSPRSGSQIRLEVKRQICWQLLHFSKPIFLSTAMKRSCKRRPSQAASVFNSGSQEARSSTPLSSQSSAAESSPP